MGDELLPVLALRRTFRRLIQGEVDAGLVAAHEPAPLAIQSAMVGVVLVVFLARSEAGPAAFRFVGRQYPGFAGGLAVGEDHQLTLGTGAVAMHEITTIRIVIDLAAAFAAEAVTVDLVRAMGVVEFAEEQRLVVVGPDHAAVAVVEGQGGDFAACQVLDEQPVDLVALGVEAVGQLAVILADAERT